MKKMETLRRKVFGFFKVSDYERALYERFYFTLPQKLKYCLSRQFREEIVELVSEYDFQEKLYDENQRFYEEIEQSIDIIAGGLVLEKALQTIRKEESRKEVRKKIETYQRLLKSLKDANGFYNSWNEERHNKYKKSNCKRLLLDLVSRFKEGNEYVVLLKVEGRTSLLEIETQIRNIEDKGMGLIFGNKIFPGDYYINIDIDGIIFKKGCPLMTIFNAVLDGFSYLPVTKLMIQSYL